MFDAERISTMLKVAQAQRLDPTAAQGQPQAQAGQLDPSAVAQEGVVQDSSNVVQAQQKAEEASKKVQQMSAELPVKKRAAEAQLSIDKAAIELAAAQAELAGIGSEHATPRTKKQKAGAGAQADQVQQQGGIPMGVSNGGAQVPQKLARIESFLKVAGLVEWATKALTRAKGGREALNAADREFMESTHGSSGGYGEGPNLKPGIVEKGLGMAVKADEAFKAPFNKADELVGKKLSDVKGKRTAANEAALKQQATAEEFAGAESGYGAPAAELKGKGLGEKALTGAKKVTEVAKNSPYLTTAGVLGAGTGTAAALGALSDKDEEETTTGGDATPMAPGMLDSLAQWWQEKGELPGNLTPSQAAAALVALGVTAGGVGYGIHKAVKGKKKKSGEGHEADSSERKSED